jgi:hypothetical protein
MITTSQETKDHQIIREWIDERQGAPAVIRNSNSHTGNSPLRIKFDETTDELQEISWEEFFKIFDEQELTFLYDTDRSSRLSKFIYKD